jgi:hypothetical protein
MRHIRGFEIASTRMMAQDARNGIGLSLRYRPT